MENKINVKSSDFIISLYDNCVFKFPFNIEELTEWFKDHGLSEVEEFLAWRCQVNGVDKYFSIKRGEGETWNVHKMVKEDEEHDFYKVYFSFCCEIGKEFVSTFENALINKIQDKTENSSRFKTRVSYLKVISG